MLADVEALLNLADEQMVEVVAEYEKTLTTGEFSPRLRALIKNVLENYRSSLEYVANAVAERYATNPPPKVYWPFSYDSSTDAADGFDKNFPGVRSTRPDIAEAWARFQPHSVGFEWIGPLIRLSNENKHQLLTAQKHAIVTRTRRTFGGNVYEHTYVDWRFDNPEVPLSALTTLRKIQNEMRPMLQELCSICGL